MKIWTCYRHHYACSITMHVLSSKLVFKVFYSELRKSWSSGCMDVVMPILCLQWLLIKIYTGINQLNDEHHHIDFFSSSLLTSGNTALQINIQQPREGTVIPQLSNKPTIPMAPTTLTSKLVPTQTVLHAQTAKLGLLDNHYYMI